jgi:glyoxylase-like metal-dependent hydrolase (beta-lactamase superfamily II)
MLRVEICKVEKLFFFKNFTYLVFDTNNKYGIIIDPAWDLEFIKHKIEENNIILKGILITHTHFDHINLAGALVDEYNCDVFVGDAEFRYSDFNTNNLISITDENNFLVGNINIYPIFTPGHSPGSICYLIEDNLFTGDTLFIEGCGMCFGDKTLSNPAHLFYSLQKLKQIIPDDTKIYPGHSYGEYPGQLMKEIQKKNVYLNFENKEKFISYRMRKKQKGFFNFK